MATTCALPRARERGGAPDPAGSARDDHRLSNSGSTMPPYTPTTESVPPRRTVSIAACSIDSRSSLHAGAAARAVMIGIRMARLCPARRAANEPPDFIVL
jgi:hypothetical protein